MASAEIVNQIRSLSIPESFATRSAAFDVEKRMHTEALSLPELELMKLQRIHEVLTHPELQSLIDEGQITLGLIKPHANEGKFPEGTSDEEAAQEVLTAIKDKPRKKIKLETIFSINLKLSKKQAALFYAPLEARYFDAEITDPKTGHKTTVWTYNNKFIASGPLTFILLYDKKWTPEKGAAEHWREKIGPTDPQKAPADTLRGKFGYVIENNIVHGSNDKEEVKREVKVLADIIAHFIEKSKKNAAEKETDAA